MTKAVIELGDILDAHQIFDDGVVGTRLETVGKAGRNIEHRSTVLGQFVYINLTTRRRLLPQIDDDVMDLTDRAADDLCIGLRRPLKMHPANRAPPTRDGRVRLNRAKIDPLFRKTSRAPGSSEFAARIGVHDELDESCIRVAKPSRFHGLMDLFDHSFDPRRALLPGLFENRLIA